MSRLLILACSARKRLDRSALPAIERYDGVNFRVLKKLQREHAFPHDLDVLILSAKYGLLRPETPIKPYDLKMTERRAAELCASVSCDLDRHLQEKKYGSVFVNLGKTYLNTLALSSELKQCNVQYATGGIGSKMKQMKAWILRYETDNSLRRLVQRRRGTKRRSATSKTS
jgi:cytoplasmic iron level regulating protein YaaA (DUF328/UPF0246 family)